MTHEETVQWLYDRAQISDLLYKFARLLDTRQWKEYMCLYAEDGVMELPWATIPIAEMAAAGGPRLLPKMYATHHISSNHQIEVSGDTARSNSYLQAMHLLEPDNQATQWLVGGWYDNEYRRTAAGWRLTKVKATSVWESGARPAGAHAGPKK